MKKSSRRLVSEILDLQSELSKLEEGIRANNKTTLERELKLLEKTQNPKGRRSSIPGVARIILQDRGVYGARLVLVISDEIGCLVPKETLYKGSLIPVLFALPD